MAATLLHTIGAVQLAAQRSKSSWGGGALFTELDDLKPDYVGKVGELFLAGVCRDTGIDHNYADDDKNSTDGTYDIVIRGKKVQIKTARLGVQGAFQHENLRDSGCDYYAFIDVAPHDFYLSIVPKFDMKVKHPIFGRKPHLRKGAHNIYKLDFSEASLVKAIKSGVTFRVFPDTPTQALSDFMIRQIARE